MLEQMTKIAECLTDEGLDWSCSFTTHRVIGGRNVRITVQDTGKCLVMTAHVPHRIDDMDFDRYRDLADRLNSRTDFGEFRVNEDEMELNYWIYSMRTHEGEIKGEETISCMLDQCQDTLERFSDEFVLEHVPTFMERVRELVGLHFMDDEYDNDAEYEYEYDDPYDDPERTSSDQGRL